MIRRILATAALTALTLGVAEAGPQYVDESGFANGGYDPVAYFALPQMPVGEPQPEAVPGRASITAEYNGATWTFASEENRKAFLAEPQKYAPAYDGHCAYGLAKGGKVPGNPNLWRIVDGKLYLNITPTVVDFWESDIPGNLEEAETNWQSAESKAASEQSWKALSDNDGTYSKPAPTGK